MGEAGGGGAVESLFQLVLDEKQVEPTRLHKQAIMDYKVLTTGVYDLLRTGFICIQASPAPRPSSLFLDVKLSSSSLFDRLGLVLSLPTLAQSGPAGQTFPSPKSTPALL